MGQAPGVSTCTIFEVYGGLAHQSIGSGQDRTRVLPRADEPTFFGGGTNTDPTFGQGGVVRTVRMTARRLLKEVSESVGI